MFGSRAIANYLYLLLLSAVSVTVIQLLARKFPQVPPSGISFTAILFFAFSSLLVLMLFFAGTAKNPERSVFFTFVALGVKMLLSLIIALFYFLVFKNTDTGSVILFFVLYLEFTFFIVLTLLRLTNHSSD